MPNPSIRRRWRNVLFLSRKGLLTTASPSGEAIFFEDRGDPGGRRAAKPGGAWWALQDLNLQPTDYEGFALDL
jgi:hypothetical protein